MNPTSWSPASWSPVARSDDLPARHVFQGQLLGRELAIWRADDGHVNVWENRCLHRGVRLTIGRNHGAELVCQYHGWRYANRTAGCVYIPAHPADAPARTICNVRFPVVERHGLVWTTAEAVTDGEQQPPPMPSVPALDAGQPFGLRNLPVDVEPDVALAELARLQLPIDGAERQTSVTDSGDGWVELTAASTSTQTSPGGTVTAVFFVQPVDSARSVVRGVLTQPPPAGTELSELRRHANVLGRWRSRVEAEASGRPRPAPLPVRLAQAGTGPDLAADRAGTGRGAGRSQLQRVEVTRKWTTADDVAGFELTPIAGDPGLFQPGAHLDVQLPNGLVRQYSLVNRPGESHHYVIGVKREPASTGGSACLHDVVREGDVLAVSEPRNNFALRRDSFHTTLIAGGIGITPLLAMALALEGQDLDYRLHRFARSSADLAFEDRADLLGDRVVTHLGLDPAATTEALGEILDHDGDVPHGHAVYVCGPGPMMDATRRLAAEHGWPDEAVHFEYFANANEIDRSSSFEVELARSALTVPVPAGTTIVDALAERDVWIPTSCRQGACGSCVVPVLDGRPDHQDVHLNRTERERGDRIVTCVSRAESDRLVLDL